MRRCLVIDDDPIAAIFLVDLLSARGWIVDQARSLAQAEASLAAHRYDHLLADCRLPDGDGVAWLRQRRLAPDWPASMRCLVTSGDLLAADALPDGVAQLRKPLDVKRLCQWLTTPAIRGVINSGFDATHGTANALPLLDDTGALQKFGGRIEALIALRGMLLAELQDSQRWRAQLAEIPPQASALDSLHRLRAACALTGCARLGRICEALEQDLRHGLAAQAQCLQDLDAAVLATIAAI